MPPRDAIPTRQPVVISLTKRRNRMARWRSCDGAALLRALWCEADVLVHFVAEDKNVAIGNDLPELLDVAVLPDGRRWIVWGIDDHQFGAVGDLIGEFRPVHFEFRRLELDALHHAACQFHCRSVAVIARVEGNHFVTFRHQRGDRDVQGFRRTGSDGDVGIGVGREAVNLFGFRGNGFTQRCKRSSARMVRSRLSGKRLSRRYSGRRNQGQPREIICVMFLLQSTIE